MAITDVSDLTSSDQDQVFIGADNANPTLQEWYTLNKGSDGKPIFGTTHKNLEEVPSDDWELVVRNVDQGVGGAMAAAGRLTTTEKGRIFAMPAFTTFGAGGDILTPPRYSFEEQDANGRWYLYLVSPEQITKVDIGVDPPVVRQVYDIEDDPPIPSGARTEASDHFGQPVRGKHSGVSYIYFPLNNGVYILKMTLPVEVDTGAGTGDTFTEVSSILEGASHFKALASGKIIRSNASHDVDVHQNKSEISFLSAGSDAFEDDDQWGADFPLGNAPDYITAIMSYEELAIIRKSDDHWYTAVELEDATIQFRDILPDEISAARAPLGEELNHTGATWHGKLFLPTSQTLWRHNLASALPVDLAAIYDGVSDTDIDLGESFRQASVGAVVGAGTYLWATFIYDDKEGFLLAAGRERRSGDNSPYEILWFPVFNTAISSPARVQLIHIQKNGEGAPRLWSSVDLGALDKFALYLLDLGKDGGPAKEGGTFGGTNLSGSIWYRDILLESSGFLRETRILIEDPQTSPDVAWRPYMQWDGGSYVEIGTGGVTSTGSVFATRDGTDAGRRLRIRLDLDSQGATASTSPSTVREVRVQGHYTPDVGKIFEFSIDIIKTAERTDRTPEKVISDLEAHVKQAADWIDRHSNAGDIHVTGAETREGARIGGVVAGPQDYIVTASLLEYS